MAVSGPKTFAQKMLASADKIVCPVCKTDMQLIRLVASEKSEKTDAWKYNNGITKVCKCNEKEIYG